MLKNSKFILTIVKYVICLFFIVLNSEAQNAKLTCDELIELYLKETDSIKKEENLLALLKKAKEEKDIYNGITGHHLAALFYKDERIIQHSDSLIYLSENNNDSYYPTTAYLIKGIYYYEKQNLKKALDNYLLANKYAKTNFNQDFIFKSNYSVGVLKGIIAEHEDAINLHKENYIYVKNNRSKVSSKNYLQSIFALANTYNELHQLDSAFYYNNLGVKESKKLNLSRSYNHFVLNEGVRLFYDQRYVVALDSINKALPYFENSNDHPNSAIGYFYKAKAFKKLKRDNEALPYFKKIDTIFSDNTSVLPKLRETYEILIDYYKEKNDLEQQLNYIKRLIKFDSTLNTNEVYLSNKIIKEYDFPKLILEKENIISALKSNKASNNYIMVLLTLFLICITGVSYYQYQKNLRYKNRFDALLESKEIESNLKEESVEKENYNISISDEIIEDILKKLESFETSNSYLDNKVSLRGLTKKMKTNSNYLSKVVNHYKKQSFANYISALRVEYAINRLKEDKSFRKYTIKAIAFDVGFNNSESFSKAFYKRTGIKPSYFVKQLEKI